MILLNFMCGYFNLEIICLICLFMLLEKRKNGYNCLIMKLNVIKLWIIWFCF